MDLAAEVLAFAVRIEVYGFEVREGSSELIQEPLQDGLQLHAELTVEGASELAAAKADRGSAASSLM